MQRTIRTILVGTCAASALGVCTAWLGEEQALYSQERRSSDRRANDQGVEFLTRGPVHEAFAEPVVFRPEGEFIISQEPPAPIEEIPPEQGPDGAVWIPGYWSWDDEGGDFLWVSGFWRVLPPDMDWVPGYWAKISHGYRWVSGFWKPIELHEVTYLPEPPEMVDEAPYADPPSADQIWVPGTWMWHEHRYAWRPGYYAQARPGWIWSPAHYVWTPTGYIFIDGFWDLSVRRRGLLFAPVSFEYPVRSGFVLTPSVVIDADIFVDHLFINPRHGHYYFGDYYDYVNTGFYPWFDFHLGRHGYDPIFAYYNWHYSRRDRHWVNHLRDDFRFRHDHRDARPPRRFSEMERLVDRGSRRDRSQVLATSFDKFVSRKDTQFKFVKLEENRREEIKERVKKDREFRDERVKLESEKDKSALKSKEPTKLKMANSPLASVAREHGSKEKPPEKPKTPDVDQNKEPRSREGRSDRDRDTARGRDADRDRSRQGDRDRDTVRSRDTDRDQNRQADRDRDRRDDEDRTRTDRTRGEQLGDRTRPDQPRAKEDRRERGYARPDEQPRQKSDEPKSKTDQRPGSDASKDKPKTQERTRQDQPVPRSDSQDRLRQERSKTDESRDRSKPERTRGDEQRDRTRPDRPTIDNSRDRSQLERDRMKTDRPKVDDQRDRTKSDRPKTEEPKGRTDRPKAEEPRERTRQERPKADEPRERAKSNRSPSEERQARSEPRGRVEAPKEQAKPERSGREQQRKETSGRAPGERPKEAGKPDRANESKDKDKDKDKDKKNP